MFGKDKKEDAAKAEETPMTEEPVTAEDPQAEAVSEEKTPETSAEEAGASDSSESAAEEKKDAEAATQPEPPKPTEPDWKDLYARLLADFDNYKKRVARDREETYQYAEGRILESILPTADDLNQALEHAKDKEDPFVKGVTLVRDNLLAALKGHGVEPFDSVGQPLDVEKMSAMTVMPSDTVPADVVLFEAKKGWMHGKKVLRAAQVVVSSGKKTE